MIPNNNLSVLPWYTSIEQQNARKWWLYGRVYPLFTPAGFLLPFQILLDYRATPSMSACVLFDANTNTAVDSAVATKLNDTGFTFKQFSALGYTVAVYPALLPAFTSLANGRYYLRITINGVYYYSEIFTVVNDIQPYLKITWWDVADFTMDAGTIVYTTPARLRKRAKPGMGIFSRPNRFPKNDTGSIFWHPNTCWTLCGLFECRILPKSNTTGKRTV